MKKDEMAMMNEKTDLKYESPVMEEFSYSKLARLRGASGCDIPPGGDDCGTDSEEEIF